MQAKLTIIAAMWGMTAERLASRARQTANARQ
jgi:hypothetical protein